MNKLTRRNISKHLITLKFFLNETGYKWVKCLKQSEREGHWHLSNANVCKHCMAFAHSSHTPATCGRTIDSTDIYWLPPICQALWSMLGIQYSRSCSRSFLKHTLSYAHAVCFWLNGYSWRHMCFSAPRSYILTKSQYFLFQIG